MSEIEHVICNNKWAVALAPLKPWEVESSRESFTGLAPSDLCEKTKSEIYLHIQYEFLGYAT